MNRIEIETKAFGTLPVEQKQIFTFPAGLYGFESHKKYALFDSRQPPFYWLQSLDEAMIAFVVMNPYMIWPEYVLDIPEGDLDLIERPIAEDLLVFSIVTIPDDPSQITCNLQGPLVMNRLHQLGVQSISLDQRWKTKHPIMERDRA